MSSYLATARQQPKKNPTPAEVARVLIAAAGKKLYAVLDVGGLDEQDVADLAAPLNEVAATLGEVRRQLEQHPG